VWLAQCLPSAEADQCSHMCCLRMGCYLEAIRTWKNSDDCSELLEQGYCCSIFPTSDDATSNDETLVLLEVQVVARSRIHLHPMELAPFGRNCVFSGVCSIAR
jgi:hypothetical protein